MSARRGFHLSLQKDGVSPTQKDVFYYLTSQPMRPRSMKPESGLVPPGLPERPLGALDLEAVELIERAMRARFGFSVHWSFNLADAWRSLKCHGSGSSPERVLDLLCLLFESSGEKMQKMDLDDITLEHLTAARSALWKVIGKFFKAELAVNREWREWWNCGQDTLWLRELPWPCLGSKALPMLQAMDARAIILMTRLEREAQKENDALSCFCMFFLRVC